MSVVRGIGGQQIFDAEFAIIESQAFDVLQRVGARGAAYLESAVAELGYALAEEVRFEGGAILDTNFDTYEIPRFSWLPEIETVIIDAKGDPPQGGGPAEG